MYLLITLSAWQVRVNDKWRIGEKRKILSERKRIGSVASVLPDRGCLNGIDYSNKYVVVVLSSCSGPVFDR